MVYGVVYSVMHNVVCSVKSKVSISKLLFLSSPQFFLVLLLLLGVYSVVYNVVYSVVYGVVYSVMHNMVCSVKSKVSIINLPFLSAPQFLPVTPVASC